ncbi:MAG TPA: hypothetical protein VIW03_00590 [Anaeromyxobacter sp.]
MGVGGLGFGAGGGSGADEPGEHVMASTPYEIPDLRDHAFLVVNGDELVLVSEAQDAAARPLSLEEITVPKLGAVVEGQLVYEVPERGVTSLAFRYLDSAWGHVDLALLGKAPPRPKAIAGPASNDLLEVVVYAVEEKQEAYGARAPPGKRLAVIHAGFTNRDEENVVRVDLARYATLRDGREAFRAAGGAKGGGVLRGEVQLLPRALRRGALVFEVAERHGPLTLALKLPEYGSLTLALPRN